MSDGKLLGRMGAGRCEPTLPLGVIGLLLGVVYGYAIATQIMPTLEILSAVVSGAVMALCVMGFWRLLSALPGDNWIMRALRGAVAALAAVPVGALLATVVILILSAPETVMAAPAALGEFALFMMRMTVMQLGLLTLPTAALAGAAAVRWCDWGRPTRPKG